MKKNKRIPSAFMSITNTEVNYVSDAIKNGWDKNWKKHTNKFIEKFSKYIGVKYCLPVSHCTAAIHLSLLALNIKKGDEVIVPNLTWVACASPILYLGAKPVFIDIDENTLCLDTNDYKKKITKKTKAIIAVDLLGNMPNYDEIIKVSKKNKIKIIEDAAESIGAKFKNKKAGTFGDVSVFSFNATKLFMSGQGGCLCTNNFKIYEKAKIIANHGIDKEKTGKYYWSTELGYNYNWTNLQASLALAQLSRISELINYKKNIYKLYLKYFSKIKNVQITKKIQNTNQTFWIVYAICDKKINKEKFCESFQKYKIDMRPMFYTLSSMTPFKAYNNNNTPISDKISNNSVMLPNGYNLNEDKIKRIALAFNRILNG